MSREKTSIMTKKANTQARQEEKKGYMARTLHTKIITNALNVDSNANKPHSNGKNFDQ